MVLALTKIEQRRFDQILGMLERGQFYSIKDIRHSKSFLRSFALDSRKMVSNGGENAEKKPTGDAAHIMGDEGESRPSRGDSPKVIIPEMIR